MIKKIIEIIQEETWIEVDSAQVYGIEEAAKKILEFIEKRCCSKCGGGIVKGVPSHCSQCMHAVKDNIAS